MAFSNFGNTIQTRCKTKQIEYYVILLRIINEFNGQRTHQSFLFVHAMDIFFCIEYSFQYREEKKIRHIFGPNVILSTTQIARHVRIVSGFISREKKPLRLLNTSFM